MGSSQSASSSDRISVDEHGNISRGPKPTLDYEDIQNQAPETTNDLPQDSPTDTIEGFSVGAGAFTNESTPDRDLNEVDEKLQQIRSKYLVDNTPSLFSLTEKELLSCYANNKSQPLRCVEQFDQYRSSVARHRKHMMSTLTTAVMITLCLLHVITIGQVDCFGSMSVDLGSEWMKVGLVAPSIQMDIVLNPHSQRKTPMAISILNGERYIGDAAADIASKYPEKTFTHFLDLVGKSEDHESVKVYKQRFPHANITRHENSTSTIVLSHPEGMNFTPVELIAMMLEHAHDQVLNRLNHLEPVNDVVLTVPPYFDQTERNAVSTAANLIGLNPLQLINTNAAFALSYGVFRHRYDQGNKTSILFYDQGASSTSATIADYEQVELLNPDGSSKNETVPQVSIRAMTYDRYLGGFDMQLRLRDHLATEFAKQSGIKLEKILARGKSAAKLLKEAGRVKKVLSANADYVVKIENVMDDKDLKVAISRQEYENMCKDLLSSRATRLIEDLMFQTDMTRKDLETVIIVGGNTRTPKIQQVIIEYMGLEQLGKSINADEGAALAALYQAASLGRGFRVKKFILKDVGDQTVTPAQSGDEQQQQNVSISNETNTTVSVENQNLLTIYSEEDINSMRLRLRHLREKEILRIQRLSLRNSLESLIVEAKEKESLEEETQKLVVEISTWIDDVTPELQNVTLLAEKYTALHTMIYPVVVPEPLPEPQPEPETTVPSPSTIEEILSKFNVTADELKKRFVPGSTDSPEGDNNSTITIALNATQTQSDEPQHTEL